MRLESNRLALGIEEECLFCWCNFLWRLFYGHQFGTLLGMRDFWQKTWVFEVCHWVFWEISWDFASVLLFFALFKLNVQMYIYNKHKNWAHKFFSWISWLNFDGVFGKVLVAWVLEQILTYVHKNLSSRSRFCRMLWRFGLPEKKRKK